MKKLLRLKTMLLLGLMFMCGTQTITADTYTIGWGTASGDEGTYTNFTSVSGTVTGIVSFSTTKNSASNPAYNSSSNELRLYYHSSGNGGSITLTPATNITITGVVMTTSTSPSVNYSVDGGTATSVTVSSNTYTISDISATTSLTIQNVNTSNTQLRIKKIEITYTNASSNPDKTNIATLNSISPTTLSVGDIGDFTLDATFADGTTVGEDYEIEWSSDNTSVLDVTGETYEAKAVGTANVTVRVTVLDDETYNEVNKTFAVTVKKAAHVKAYNEVFYESFDDCSSVGGNDNQWSSINPSGTIATDNEDTWTFTNGAAASECAKFGTGSAGGSATATMSLAAGTYTLSFKAGAWNKSNEGTTLSLEATGATLNMSEFTTEMGKFNSYDATLMVEEAGEVSFTFSTGAGNNRFFLDEVQLLIEYSKITITNAEYATYCGTRALDFSTTGITAYTATDEETKVTLNEITSGKVPANTPVVLYKEGADGTAISVPVIASAEAVGDNDLQVSTGTDVENMYVLAMNPTIGFYPWAGDSDLSAGKVYLQGKASYGARAFIGFDDNETTGIASTAMQPSTEPYYDLQGRRVAQPTKGLYIVNRRKVVIK